MLALLWAAHIAQTGGELMSEEKMVFNHHFAIERMTIEVTAESARKFMQEAAAKLATEMLANGCLVHQSEYDIESQRHREVITVLVAQRQRSLP